MAREPLGLAVTGMGGFAREHHRAVRELEPTGVCRLVATCDPDRAANEDLRDSLAFGARGVREYDDFIAMLDACASELDVVTIPTPIPLHAAMHREVLRRGLACYLEKPPTLDPEELEEMITADSRARKATNVGFNFTIEQSRRDLKERLQRGEFGALQSVAFVGLWPRGSTYFERTPWAGRLWMDDQPVLDSCIGNALSHFLHCTLQWCGRDGWLSWDEVTTAEAEAYRANDIEGADTFFIRGRTEAGVDVRVAVTHSCFGAQRHYERLECEKAVITYVTWDAATVEWRDGRAEHMPADRRDFLPDNLNHYLSYVEGLERRPLNRLVDCRPFVRLNALAYLAADRIVTVREPHVARTLAGGGESVEIDGIAEACEALALRGRMPSQDGRPWAVHAGRATVESLPRLRYVIRRMAEERAQERQADAGR